MVFKTSLRNFPGDPVVKTLLPMQEAQVQFLAGKLRSHMPHSVTKIKVFIQDCTDLSYQTSSALLLQHARLLASPRTSYTASPLV